MQLSKGLLKKGGGLSDSSHCQKEYLYVFRNLKFIKETINAYLNIKRRVNIRSEVKSLRTHNGTSEIIMILEKMIEVWIVLQYFLLYKNKSNMYIYLKLLLKVKRLREFFT